MKRVFVFIFLAPASVSGEPVDYVVENAAAIPAPLSGDRDEALDGAILYRSAGCADCHDTEAAPSLETVAARLTEGEIRLMIVEPRIALPETKMPAYYTPGRFGETAPDLVGRTRLTAAEIEAIIEFLLAGAAK